jgi:uncharacterized membrane protein
MATVLDAGMAEVTGVQRALQRGLHPLLSTLPLFLFGGAVLIDLGAMVSGFQVFGEISYWVATIALLVGLVTATVQLVDFTTSPVGCVAHRVRGISSASLTAAVAGFTLAWYVRGGGHAAPGGAVLLLEVFAFLIGLVGSAAARVTLPRRGLLEVSAEQGWPFNPAS